jgi:2-polyprenyl-3-methyl-5-hydroxy-6-metoxy-1,4-benzoquinol methylase
MRPRIRVARFLIRLGTFIKSMSIRVMRPDDLIEFGRQSYARPNTVNCLSSEEVTSRGLDLFETGLLEKVPVKKGRLLLLGVGGGREAVSLAHLGFAVTGVDFIPELVEKAKENAAKKGVMIEGLVQEISQLEVPPGSYDLVWLSNFMYSAIPTRRRRVQMLRRIHQALTPSGHFICSFQWGPPYRYSPAAEFVRKVFAFLTLGNLWFEPGDVHTGLEFFHVFSSEAELISEFDEGGLTVMTLQIPEGWKRGRGGALLQGQN